MTTLSQALRSRRIRLGEAQGAIAAALGVSQGAVSLWESGAVRPRADRVAAIAAAYGIRPATLRSLWLAGATS